jgi:ribosomal protein S18 acetylase RimI-like enzyme
MPTNIREAAPTDEEAVIALWNACGLVVSYNNPASDYRFAITNDGSAVLVAENDTGRLIGTAMVGQDGHRGWLYYVASAPDCRGKGIGKGLINAAEQWLGDRGVAKVQLMVREGNRAVVPFYEQLGYKETPRILMSRWIRQPKL